jgi:hypothetical protein
VRPKDVCSEACLNSGVHMHPGVVQVPKAAGQLTQVLAGLRHTFVVADATLPDCPLVYASEGYVHWLFLFSFFLGVGGWGRLDKRASNLLVRSYVGSVQASIL